jgi:SAM-dependent methyltransferase
MDSDLQTHHEAYFQYLRQRSALGLLYRRLWLYPRLTARLTGRVLDVGCGIGDFLRSCPGSTGTDVNPLAVEWCRRQGLEARVMQPDHLPFEAASFGGVVLDNVLEHLTTPGPLLLEIRRVLVAAGHLLIGVPGRRGYAGDPDHKIFYDEELLERVVGAANFRRKEIFYMPLKSSWLDARLPQYCLYGVFVPV